MNSKAAQRTARQSRGFTLIEVMVALTIFAVSVTALSGTFHSNVRNATYLKTKTLAHWLAQNELVDLRARQIAQNAFPQPTDRRDKREYAGRQWVVRTQVSKTPVQGFHKVEISVGPETTGEFSAAAIVEGFLSDPN